MKEGFFISCNRNKEKKALQEFASLLPSKPPSKTTNFEKQLEAELSQKRPFTKLEIKNLKNILILYIDNCMEIFNQIERKTKYINRLIPLQSIFFIEEMEEKMNEFIDTIKLETIKLMKKDLSFKINIERRLCCDLKDQIFGIILSKLDMRVDLKNPDYLFEVQISKNVIGVSFIKNVNFNIQRNNRVIGEK